ncbi:MAG: 4-(cytidine 5'-diphospho)-2-C-methyl-D-erythritol kinase [Lachnospiraceae bacterium]|nr:4-(cytidine 5'-diphospho)-2-C-methyl-D-erythritol kinase [Lachnospiraceae bacterium]
MDNITVKAYGKINIALDILGRRADGYHEVSMIMQSVSLADELVFEKTCEPGITLMCDKNEIAGDTNIICKAYHALNAYIASRDCASGCLGGVRCTLTKNIPIAAGMAGGSTDAAATLKALNELFSLGLSSQELADIAVKLGADVPYCLMGGTALSEGIGEKLTALPSLPECSIVLVHPHISVSTKEVYEAYDRVDHTFHPDITRIRQCIEAGDLDGVCAIVGNVLEEATIPMHPQISDIKKGLAHFNPLCTLMTGSGPTVFALFQDESKAKKASEHFKSHSDALDVYVVHPM